MKKLTISSFALAALAAVAMILGTSSVFAQSASGTFNFSLSATAPTNAYWQGGHGDIDYHEHEPGDWEIHYHFHAATNAPGPIGGNGFPGTPDVHDGENEWKWEPGDLTTWIDTGVPSLTLTRPGGTQWDFTGVGSGQTLYVLPTTQVAGLPFIGFSAEDHTFDVIYTLGAVTGGTISAWTADGFGNPTALWSSSSPGDTLDNNSLAVLAGGHEHVFVGFSQVGDYTAEISAVPEPSTYALLGLGAGALALLRWRKRSRQS
jgi:hypothetical protein